MAYTYLEVSFLAAEFFSGSDVKLKQKKKNPLPLSSSTSIVFSLLMGSNMVPVASIQGEEKCLHSPLYFYSSTPT